MEPARAERLDDHPPVVHPQQHIEDLRVQAGGELDEEHLLAQGVPEDAGAGHRGDGLLPQVQPRPVHTGHQGPVDALKRAEGGGVGFHGAAAQHHPPVEGQKHPRTAGGRHGEGGAEIVQPVGEGVLDGQLGPGEHHGYGDVPHHVAEDGGGVGHGVGAVGDDDAVKAVPGGVDVPGDEPPLLRLDVGGVQVEDVPDGEVIAVRQAPQVAGQVLPVQAGGQTLVGEPGGDGAAGGEQ